MTERRSSRVTVTGPRPVAHPSHPMRVSHRMGFVNTVEMVGSDYIYNRAYT